MITVVMPVGQTSQGLIGTLSALVSAAAEGVVRDVVLVGDSRNADLVEIAEVTGAVLRHHEGHRAAALRVGGMSDVRGEWLLFLEPGVRLEPDWFHSAAEFIQQAVQMGRRDKVATFRYRPQSKHLRDQLRRFGFGLRAQTAGVPARDQGLLINRQYYCQLGGHQDLEDLADAALWRRLGARRTTRLAAGLLPVDPSTASGARAPLHGLRMALVCLKIPPTWVARLL